MRVELEGGVRIVITDTSQTAPRCRPHRDPPRREGDPPMIGFPSGVRVHLALDPHVMCKSFNGLALADLPRNYRPPSVISI